jgi:hypothetical protein
MLRTERHWVAWEEGCGGMQKLEVLSHQEWNAIMLFEDLTHCTTRAKKTQYVHQAQFSRKVGHEINAYDCEEQQKSLYGMLFVPFCR